MVLYTKCIYSPIEKADGIRICVMSRLTEDDGKTAVKDLFEGKLFDYWAKVLAPPDNLVGSWYRGKIDWSRFSETYRDYLSQEEVNAHVRFLAKSSLDYDLTLLCVEEKPDYCHRSLLALECKNLEKRLKIKIS
jgi:uncharacterized protein YeaO (DUF488 family)